MKETSMHTISIERLAPRHLPEAHALSVAVKWPHRLEDWQFFFALGRGFAALKGSELIGTALWWPFGESSATLGMVIVASSMQGQGIGRRLMDAALAEAGPRAVRLNATADGVPLYEKLGFRPIGKLHQHQAANPGAKPERLPEGMTLRALQPEDLAQVIALDEQAAGFTRAELLATLVEIGEGLVLERGGRIVAWSIFRRFGRGFVIGPVCAAEDAAAKALIAAWIERHPTEFLRIDVPVSSGLSPWLEARGLPRVDAVVTMLRGDAAPRPETGPELFALSSQALG